METPVKIEGLVAEEMWKAYEATRDPAVRDEILTSNLHLVRYIVSKTFPLYKNYADMDDVIQNGIMALFDAIEKFDPSRGNKFETYASFRIRGSVVDYMRKQDWMPRNVRKRARDIETAQAAMYSRLGREPTGEELANEVNMTADQITKILSDAYGYSVVSFEELLHDRMDDEELTGGERPEAKLFEDELHEALAASIGKLSDNEKTVISLYYYEELKLKEIAQVLSLSEARISQIHHRAVEKLRASLRE